MNLVFWIKGENGKLEYRGIYFFGEEELTRLRSDFEKYCQGTEPIKGNSYECKCQNHDMIVFLKFDEIVFIGYAQDNKNRPVVQIVGSEIKPDLSLFQLLAQEMASF